MYILFQLEDIFNYHTINDISCVPALEAAAYEVHTINSEQGISLRNIWLAPLAGGSPRQFTYGDSDSMPRWSPDGSQLAFLSSRQGTRQIYLLPRNGGQARQLGRFASGVMSIEWTPDGRYLLACCTATADPRQHNNHNTMPVNHSRNKLRLVWNRPDKIADKEYALYTAVHLFLIDVSNGVCTQLTKDSCIVRGANGSTDGKRIVYTRTRDGQQMTHTELWMMDTDGKNARQIASGKIAVQYPKWSPDGRYIVFVGSDEQNAHSQVWLFDFADGTARALSNSGMEVVPETILSWSADSSRIVLILANRGRQEVVSITVADGQVTRLLTGDRHISRVALTAKHLVFVTEDLYTSNELYCSTVTGKDEVQLSNLNIRYGECRSR